MQYVRSFGGSVSKTWNSLNPATLSGAIDVVVVEQDDGSLACSPFHVRFGKFSLLRPYEKKVEFKVNNVKQDYSMKLGEGGEAFFVFETSASIPESLQTSPIVSPAASPSHLSMHKSESDGALQEPEFLDLSASNPSRRRPVSAVIQPGSMSMLEGGSRAQSDLGNITPLSGSPPRGHVRPVSGDWSGTHLSPHIGLERSNSEDIVPMVEKEQLAKFEEARKPLPIPRSLEPQEPRASRELATQRSTSPPPVSVSAAISRAKNLSEKLSSSNIPSQVTESGDLMLDINGYKSSEEDALRAELIARKILAEELKGNYDIGALIGADENGNLWIYSSEEAKEAAMRKASSGEVLPRHILDDTASDPGYQSDEDRTPEGTEVTPELRQAPSTRPAVGLVTPPQTPPDVASVGDPNRNYAKTLRLTSDQLKELNLKPGSNSMSFTVNRATCQANMYYWSYNVPVVISDIDGTITKSDALGHVLNMIGRDWTHLGVAKLYTDIVANGYNILYLTSRSVGQADTTRAYLQGIVQDGFKLPRGPVILSPDRTIAALRREVYLRKPEVFKMACLRDILGLFGSERNPFYAGFGNRFTDALSYRSVNIPPNRIFTINSNAEVSLDLLTLTKYKSSYVSMREIVDHFFPPVGLLVKGGGEDFTDFNYWRDTPLELDDFSASDTEEGDDDDNYSAGHGRPSVRSEDEGSEGLDDDDEHLDPMTESCMSRDSVDEAGDLVDSMLSSIEDEQFSRKTSLEHEQSGGDHNQILRMGPHATQGPTVRIRGRSPSSRPNLSG